MKVVLVLTVLLSALAGPAAGQEAGTASASFEFPGSVQRGEDFQQEIPGGLVFRLDFIDYGPEGWSVRILDPAYPGDNFCAVVTPPYRGINALQIYAWHFFNEDRTGPNDGSVNAPGEERRFSFVTDKAAYDLAFSLLSTMLWPEDTQDAQSAALEHDGIPRENGVLTVTDITTGSIPRSDSVWIDSMEFEVELFLP